MTALPEGLTAGTWNLDATHTAANFSIRHAGISKVRGQFDNVSGTMTVGEDLESIAFNTEIAVDSISTGIADRDGHLKSADFFDTEQFPKITFTSTRFTGDTLVGNLTIKDVTREVELDVEFNGVATDPFGTTRTGLSGSTTINRKDFGLTWNAALETGGVLVSEKVAILIDAEFVAPTAA